MYRTMCPVYMEYLDRVDKQEKELDEYIEIYRHTNKMTLDQALNELVKSEQQPVNFKNYYRKLLEKIQY